MANHYDDDPPGLAFFDERHYAEDMGLLFEVFGANRMAGRVWGLLVIAAEDHLSAADLEERLQASSGSISTSTRHLINLGMIERVRVPGERRAYFQVRKGAMPTLAVQRQRVISEARRLAERGIEEFGDRPGARKRLQEMYDVYSFWEQEVPALLERYEEQRRRHQAGTE